MLKTAQISRNYLGREGRFAHSAARGVLLSHLVGACFFIAILFDRVVQKTILFTPLNQWPIRLLALWLLIDRFGKQKSVKTSAWDWIHLFFVAGYGCALVYAELYMTRDTGLTNYMQWVNQTLNAYLYFVVAREALTRRGARPDIIVRWILITLVVACGIAIAQARDISGLRHHIDALYHQAEAEARMEGPSMAWQARAPETHANSLAIILVCGFPFLIALSDLKKFRWFDWATGALILVTMFMSYSRIGILSLLATGLAVLLVLLARRAYYKAGIALFVFTGLVFVFATIVFAFDIQRFKVLITNPSPVATANDQTVGWKLREESLRRAINLAEHYPILGLNAASGANNQQDVIVRNAYTFPGLLLNVYVYSFVSYGLLGICYILAIFWMLCSQWKSLRSVQAFAAASVVMAAALIVAGLAENVLFFDQAMIMVNILMAFCVMKILGPTKTEDAVPGTQRALVDDPVRAKAG